MIPPASSIVLAIVLPWYAALYARDGWTYIVSFFVGENLDRFASGRRRAGRTADRCSICPVVFSDSFPWSLLLVPAVSPGWATRRRGAGDARAGADAAVALDPGDRRVLLVFGGRSRTSTSSRSCRPSRRSPDGSIARAGEGRGLPSTSRTVAPVGALLFLVGTALVYLARSRARLRDPRRCAIGVIGLVAGGLAMWFGLRQRVFGACLGSSRPASPACQSSSWSGRYRASKPTSRSRICRDHRAARGAGRCRRDLRAIDQLFTRDARTARVPRDRLRQGGPSPRAGDQHRDDGEDRRRVQEAS